MAFAWATLAAALVAIPLERDPAAASRLPGLGPGLSPAALPRTRSPFPSATARAPTLVRTPPPEVSAAGPNAPDLAVAAEPGRTSAALEIDGGAGGLPPALKRSNAAPGATAAMTLRIRNQTRTPVELSLRYAQLTDRPGPLGGSLSNRLILTVGDAKTGRPLYAGPPSAFASAPLGTLAPGQRRRWRLSLRFPDGGTPAGRARGDNIFQGSRLSARYVVRATEVADQPSVGTNR